MAWQAGAVASYISHHLLTDKSSGIIQPWKHHCLQGTILTYKFSTLLLDITVLLAPLWQQNWPTSSSTFHFFLPRKPSAGGFPKEHAAHELLAELPGSRSKTKGPCDTCRTHRLLLTFPDTSVPAPCHRRCSRTDFFFKKSSTQHSTHSGSGFRRKEDWQGGHGFSHGMRNKASSDSRAGLRHHLFDQGLCHPPAPHASLPGARSKLTVHLVQGRHRLLSRRHPYLQGADRDTQAQPLQGTPRFSTLPPRPIIFKACS